MSSQESRPPATLDPPQASGEAVRVRLRWEEETREVTFAGANGWLTPNPDAAFVAALPVAMGVASSLDLPDGVSPDLLRGSDAIQNVLSSWDSTLQRVELRPGAAPTADPPKGRGTAAFFTCGVDSFYTLLTRREEIDAVVFAHGLDLPRDDAKRELVSATIQGVAAELGLPAIELETDLRAAFSDATCDWERIYTSAALATIGQLLASRFERVLIPATHSYRDLHPTGSHPLLDPLYSGNRLRIEHVDAVPRVAKLEHLADSELAMSSLRVCFQPNVETLNCGQCAKCVRTMTGLRVIGAPGRCATLPAEFSLREMSSGPVRTRRSLTYVKENLAALEARGADPDLTFALQRIVTRGARFDAWEKSKRLASAGRRAARARLRRARRRGSARG